MSVIFSHTHNNIHIEVYLPTFGCILENSGIIRIAAQVDIFMYIKTYSEPTPYSEIFRTIERSSLFQARYSGINQEQFLDILNLVQADSGIVRTLAYLGTYCFRHIQAYSRSYIPGYIYLGIFVHIQAYFSIFKCIQESCTNTCSSSQVLLLITVQTYLEYFLIFVSKVDIRYILFFRIKFQ